MSVSKPSIIDTAKHTSVMRSTLLTGGPAEGSRTSESMKLVSFIKGVFLWPARLPYRSGRAGDCLWFSSGLPAVRITHIRKAWYLDLVRLVAVAVQLIDDVIGDAIGQ